MIAKVQSGLTLLLLEAVFEEHDARPLLPVILLVVHQDDHSLGIHVLSCSPEGSVSIATGGNLPV